MIAFQLIHITTRTMSAEDGARQMEHYDPNLALQIAFKTMKERCQQLEDRLATVEEENTQLRLQCGREVVKTDEKSEKSVVQILQVKPILFFFLFE